MYFNTLDVGSPISETTPFASFCSFTAKSCANATFNPPKLVGTEERKPSNKALIFCGPSKPATVTEIVFSKK